MTKTKLLHTASIISAVIFVAAEALIFYLIHIKHLSTDISLHYLSIQIAALFALMFLTERVALSAVEGKSIKSALCPNDGILIFLAMLFTLGADYHLVASEEINRMAGMIFFIGTQVCIFLHLFLRESDEKLRKIHLSVRLSLIALLVLASFIVLGNSADALAIVSLIYYANLLTSMIFAPREKSGGKLLCMGLVFFALCDINVGLVVLHDLYGGFEEGSFLYLLTHSGVDLAWIFYIPSQTIIPLTLLVREKSQKMHCSPLAQ
jgi:hypothetical protein